MTNRWTGDRWTGCRRRQAPPAVRLPLQLARVISHPLPPCSTVHLDGCIRRMCFRPALSSVKLQLIQLYHTPLTPALLLPRLTRAFIHSFNSLELFPFISDDRTSDAAVLAVRTSQLHSLIQNTPLPYTTAAAPLRLLPETCTFRLQRRPSPSPPWPFWAQCRHTPASPLSSWTVRTRATVSVFAWTCMARPPVAPSKVFRAPRWPAVRNDDSSACHRVTDSDQDETVKPELRASALQRVAAP